jgi:hypothetical protein
MPVESKPLRRSALLSFRFLGTALLGSLVMALVSAFGPSPAQIAVLGAFVSILGGLFLSYLAQDDQRERERLRVLEQLSLPLSLAGDPELYAQYLAIARGLTDLANQPDPILRQTALLKLASLSGQIGELSRGKVVFALTEAWRAVYEQILHSPNLRKYRSIAWVRTADYWQDAPGRQSMQVNFDAVYRHRVLVERIIILRDELWPRGQLLPSESILAWIEEQHNHSLRISLVRESDLAREPDLLCDLGIYGERAVGVQELDEHSRTLRFTLTFEAEAVRLAEDQWRRLSLYAVYFRALLDRLESEA